IHVGSTAWYDALAKEGMRVDVPLHLKNWAQRAATYQALSRKYWLYPEVAPVETAATMGGK
ncbi:MAG TPA: hypothetical protein VG734_18605, partial [Lacunisphaera sp.]|nr:hypothetical protein [Lacunisphaera sp.]